MSSRGTRIEFIINCQVGEWTRRKDDILKGLGGRKGADSNVDDRINRMRCVYRKCAEAEILKIHTDFMFSQPSTPNKVLDVFYLAEPIYAVLVDLPTGSVFK